MAPDPVQAAVLQILQTALGTSFDGPGNPARGEIEGWDSLTHVEIVFMLEERFDLRFSEAEIVELSSLDEIIAILRENHAT